MRGPLTLLAGLALTYAGASLAVAGILRTLDEPLHRWYWGHWTR